MPMMKSHYDQVLNGTHGHCIPAKAGVPVWIPPAVVTQALSTGMQHVDEEVPAVVAPAETSDNEADEDAFAVGLDQALLRILTRDDPADYKADNTPKAAKVVAEMSPDLRRATATEISDAFQRLQENIDLAE